jgi:hypothetical protein
MERRLALLLLLPPIGLAALPNVGATRSVRLVLAFAATAVLLSPLVGAAFDWRSILLGYLYLQGVTLVFSLSLGEEDPPRNKAGERLNICLLSVLSCLIVLEIMLLLRQSVFNMAACEAIPALVASFLFLCVTYAFVGGSLWMHGTAVSDEVTRTKKAGGRGALGVVLGALAALCVAIPFGTPLDIQQAVVCVRGKTAGP